MEDVNQQESVILTGNKRKFDETISIDAQMTSTNRSSSSTSSSIVNTTSLEPVKTEISTNNAFKRAEKHYKHYKGKTTDFSRLIDFSNLSKNAPDLMKRIHKVSFSHNIKHQ
jgi:hypothetical protein